MGCCCPEHGGVEDTTGMQIFDSFGLGSCWWSGKVGSQKYNIGNCWTWSRRMKGQYDERPNTKPKYSPAIIEPTASSAE